MVPPAPVPAWSAAVSSTPLSKPLGWHPQRVSQPHEEQGGREAPVVLPIAQGAYGDAGAAGSLGAGQAGGCAKGAQVLAEGHGGFLVLIVRSCRPLPRPGVLERW